jgi:type VI secretion system secreted protein VgrG
VTGPEGEEVYTDEMGRIKIQFHWQRPKEHLEFGANFDERSSCWVRVAYPGAGNAWGHQSIPRIGQEVLVDFIEGDIDRPIVTGVIHNGRQRNPWFSGAGSLPANRALTGIQTKEHHGQQYGELLFDDTTEQVRTKLSSEHGKTQLNQGYLIHPRRDGAGEPRGDGFELRTDRSGAMRAAEGLLLTAHAQQNANGKQLDRIEVIALLEMALSIAQEQGKSSNTHHAEGTDTEEQERLLRDVKQWEDGSNTAKEAAVKSNKAIVTLAAPDGIALATEANVTVAAGSQLDQIAAQDSNTSVGRNLRVRVGEALSMFVQRCGMKLIAAAGKIQIQAQSDEVEIGAAKKLHLFSLEEIVLDAPKITLRAQSAGVEYSSGITNKTTGSFVAHASSHSMTGPASMSAQLPGMPASTAKMDEKFIMVAPSGDPVLNVAHAIENEQGTLEGAGGTDGAGSTSLQNDTLIKRLKMFLK